MSKILVCSTEEGIREAIKSVLVDEYELILTEAAEMCQEIINNGDIRLLLIDLDKQDKPLEIIENIKSNHPNVKIVSIAQRKAEETAILAKEKGSEGYILKPIKSDELLTLCK